MFLSWLPLIPFKQNPPLDCTGWVSENFQAFSRILKWFISSLRIVKEKNLTESVSARVTLDLEKPVSRWIRSELVLYLNSFLVSYNKGAKNDVLKALVCEHKGKTTDFSVLFDNHEDVDSHVDNICQ